jgi:hypothetical protein
MNLKPKKRKKTHKLLENLCPTNKQKWEKPYDFKGPREKERERERWCVAAFLHAT